MNTGVKGKTALILGGPSLVGTIIQVFLLVEFRVL